MMKPLSRMRSLGLCAGSAAALLLIATQGSFAANAQTPKDMTLAQFEARQQAIFFKADKDGNHLVSRAEFMAARPTGDATTLGKRFDHIDANHDGSIDAAELKKIVDLRFKRLDKDGNGTLSADERPGGKKQAQ
ncbi:EF hand domain-containing protein [Neorhizobium alkalisoli]|jgi:hypothetical protein|uniref:EF hand domain-containing protein n=2 Tax=Neorhizobium alkalisoli TaxID=528178 RepID=A0A561QP28_9HYPH|nr:EF hand domain-containing protein [Neorhizobium alkalisoli]